MGKKYTYDSLFHLEKSELLKLPLCELPLSLSRSWVQKGINRLYLELKLKNFSFKPHVWVSDDWFSPDGVPGFAIPFYLLHPRLIELEREYIGEVEGETMPWLMKLLRHETGHALDNAFHLRKNKRRQKLFGLTSKPYPHSYLPNKYSKQYVRHLEGHYAQAHPDEDWAETFAVWLTPHSRWKHRYAHWPALIKLQLVDEITNSLIRKRPLQQSKRLVEPLSENQKTLGQYLKEKQRRLKKKTHQPLHRELQSLFTMQTSSFPAWKFLKTQKRVIVDQVTKETRIPQRHIDHFLKNYQTQTKKEKLFISEPPNDSLEKMIQIIAKKSHILMKRNPDRIIM